jgi:hypothetical protein
MTRYFRRFEFFLISSLLSACASLSGTQDRFAVCSYDHAWEAALDAIKDRLITRQDKDAGVIDTAWLEIPMPGRTFGALKRDLGNNKDRSRLTFSLKRIEDVTKVSFVEERQRWAFRGGSRLFGWTDTDPSAEVMHDVQRRLDSELKEHGCSVT